MKGGARPGAGRKKSVPNKRTRELQVRVEASGLSPLDYMLTVMRDKKAAPMLRFEAAKQAAPYVHSRLSAIEHSGPDGKPIQHELTNLEKARRIAFVLNKAAREKKE
jgi:hypothetical protein